MGLQITESVRLLGTIRHIAKGNLPGPIPSQGTPTRCSRGHKSVAQTALQPQRAQHGVVSGSNYAPSHCEPCRKTFDVFGELQDNVVAEVEVAEIKDTHGPCGQLNLDLSPFPKLHSCNMADETQQRVVNAAFAPPPPLWKHFTPENIKKLDQIKTEASKGEDGRPNKKKEWSAPDLRALELPSELRYLVPPDIPEGQYSVFGELQAVGLPSPTT